MRMIVVAVATAALALVPTAASDGGYHSQHIALTPVAADENGAGFVENIHANGPNVYAHEQYSLKKALPKTTYDVVIHVNADAACSARLVEGTTATFTTNRAGNGSAKHVFTPEDVGPLRGSTVHVFWTVTRGGAVAYTTDCETIQLD